MMKWIVAAVLSLAIAHTTDAEASDFDMPGAGCVPNAVTIQNNYHATSGPAVFHATGVNGVPVTVLCPISQPFNMAAPSNFSVLYSDAFVDVNHNNRVVAVYRKASKFNGAVTTIATVDSDFAPCQVGTKMCTVSVNDIWDPGNYYYYVEVSIYRLNNNFLALWGVSVW